LERDTAQHIREECLRGGARRLRRRGRRGAATARAT